MKAMVKKYGFKSVKEFHHLIANTDISTEEKLIAFKNWQFNDGSKEGLLKLTRLKIKPDKTGYEIKDHKVKGYEIPNYEKRNKK